MPVWTPDYPSNHSSEDLNFTWHARQRMRELHLRPGDVMFVLRNAEWQYAANRAIRYAFDGQRSNIKALADTHHVELADVIVVMDRQTCRIITVYRLYGRNGWMRVYERPSRPQSTWHGGQGN